MILGQQIPHLLIVKLQHGSPNQEIHIWRRLDVLEHMSECPWDDPHEFWVFQLSFHGEGLPSSCLAICEDGPIESVQNTVNNVEGRLLIDCLLLCVPIVGFIEGILLRWSGIMFFGVLD